MFQLDRDPDDRLPATRRRSLLSRVGHATLLHEAHPTRPEGGTVQSCDSHAFLVGHAFASSRLDGFVDDFLQRGRRGSNRFRRRPACDRVRLVERCRWLGEKVVHRSLQFSGNRRELGVHQRIRFGRADHFPKCFVSVFPLVRFDAEERFCGRFDPIQPNQFSHVDGLASLDSNVGGDQGVPFLAAILADTISATKPMRVAPNADTIDSRCSRRVTISERIAEVVHRADVRLLAALRRYEQASFLRGRVCCVRHIRSSMGRGRAGEGTGEGYLVPWKMP